MFAQRLTQSAQKFADLVVAVIDHHVDSGLYKNKSNVSVQIEMVGSATSLVAGKG